MTEIEKLKNSIRDMQSRPFGETFIQPLLYNILGDTKSDKNSYDALRNGKLRGEYKAIRLKAKKSNKKSTNMLEQIFSTINPDLIPFDKIKNDDAVANCQNIKPDEFDYLDYLIVCEDGMYLFEISVEDFNKYTSTENEKEKFPNWSFKHGRKETGKNGQFNIRKSNVQWHLTHTFKQKITWEEAYKIWESIKI